MKKTILALSVAVASVSAFAGQFETDLIAKFPQAQGAKIAPSFENFYSVTKGSEVVFVSSDLKYLISGQVMDLTANKSLTQELVDANRPKMKISDLNTKDAILLKGTSGKKKLFVFSDPDCPYCKQVEKQFGDLKNVSIYIFPMPLAGLHPNAVATTENIWCSKDKATAWHGYVANGTPVAPVAKCDTPIDRNLALAQKYGINGTPALIFEDGTIMPGAAATKTIQDKLDTI